VGYNKADGDLRPSAIKYILACRNDNKRKLKS
jgi:hypothetical protein